MTKKLIAITILMLAFAVGVNTVKASTSTDENLTLNGTFRFTTTPTAGYVLTSDATGNASWAVSGMPAGTTNNSTLRYNTGTSTWQENTAFTVTSAGTTSIAAGQSYTGAGAVTLTAGAGTALTVTSPVAATWSTTAGNLTLQAGSGTVSLGSSTILNATGALTLNSGAATALTIDSGTTGAVNLGTGASAKTITIGNAASTAVKIAKLGTQWGLVYTSAADGTLAQTANGTTGQCLLATTGSAPNWGSCTGGIVPLASGGTNANLTASNGGIFYSTATAGAILSGTATAGQILRSGASAAPTWSTATYPATAGTAGNILRSNGTNFVSTAAATVQSTPADPGTTVSAVGVMMGLAGSITPATSGKILFIISGDADNSASQGGVSVQIRTGTGAAPANGAALAGTAQGSLIKAWNALNASGNQRFPFSVNAVVTGLTVGTTYWIDLGVAQLGAIGTARTRDISISAVEY